VKFLLLAIVVSATNLSAAGFKDLYERSLSNLEIQRANLLKEKASQEFSATRRSLRTPTLEFASLLEGEEYAYTADGYGTLRPGDTNMQVHSISLSQILYSDTINQNLTLAGLARDLTKVAADEIFRGYTFMYIKVYAQIMLLRYSYEKAIKAIPQFEALKSALVSADIDPEEKRSRLLTVESKLLTTKVETRKINTQLDKALSQFSALVGEKVTRQNMVLVDEITREAIEEKRQNPDYIPVCPTQCLYVDIPDNREGSFALAKDRKLDLAKAYLEVKRAKIERRIAARGWIPAVKAEASYSWIDRSPENDILGGNQIPAVQIDHYKVRVAAAGNINPFAHRKKLALAETVISTAQLELERTIRDWETTYDSNILSNRAALSDIRDADEIIENSYDAIERLTSKIESDGGDIGDLTAVLELIGETLPIILSDGQARVEYITSRFSLALNDGSLGRQHIEYLDEFAIEWPEF
jgi:hypothetical protein